MVQVAFFLLNVLAVIFTLPMPLPVTRPVLSTVATEGLLLDQVIVADAPPLTEAVKAMDCPTTVDCFLGNETFLGAFFTVT